MGAATGGFAGFYDCTGSLGGGALLGLLSLSTGVGWWALRSKAKSRPHGGKIDNGQGDAGADCAQERM
jgi:hypothetical protein